MTIQPFAVRLDVTQFPPQDKHRVIFETFDNLALGRKMEVMNDHDPKPLYYQFQAERSDQFKWEYLEEGPDVWRVSIEKA